MKSIHFALAAMLSTGVLAGCQTTNTGFDQEQDVDISATRIVLPAELYKLEGFKIKSAKIRETGSYRRETVYFTGGFFSYDRYFMGGFKKRSQEKLLEDISEFFPNPSAVGTVKVDHFAIGKVFYTTFNSTAEGALGTCFIMAGDYGETVQLRGGAGTSGVTNGSYCENGDAPNLESIVVPWMKKIALR